MGRSPPLSVSAKHLKPTGAPLGEWKRMFHPKYSQHSKDNTLEGIPCLDSLIRFPLER